MTISYVITCDICINSIHKYLYICQYSVCNVLLCKCIVMSELSVKMENYNNKKNLKKSMIIRFMIIEDVKKKKKVK